jgi:CopG antitoxin of type II toxin-antitoxin system
MNETGDDRAMLDLPLAESIPDFASEEEEREFWSTHDTSLIFEQGEEVSAGPPPDVRLRSPGEPSRARKRPPAGRTDLVSLRLPAEMIDAVKAIAAERHLPYQTLMRSWIGERIDQECRSRAPRIGS